MIVNNFDLIKEINNVNFIVSKYSDSLESTLFNYHNFSVFTMNIRSFKTRICCVRLSVGTNA